MNRSDHSRPATTTQTILLIAIALAMVGVYYVYDSIAPVAELLSRELGFSDVQLGLLNAIYSFPNIVLVLLGGILIDRFGARGVAVYTAALCFAGAVLTAFSGWFPLMAAGRLLFGAGAETLYVAVFVALAQWFVGRYFSLSFALIISCACLGSYLANLSPRFAHSLYEGGWQPPLWLAAGFGALAFLCTLFYFFLDRREAARGTLVIAAPSERIDWRNLLRFRREYWYIIGLCVTFSAVILPFRSTFAIKYLQHAHHLSLSEAAAMNSYVALAAIFATPAFGILADRIGRHALLMVLGSVLLPLSIVSFGASGAGLWLPTALLGVSFSLVPAVLWPSVARYVRPEQTGTAYGLMGMLQNTGLTLANVVAGYLNDHNGAGAAHPQGYTPMLWFFGILSFAGFIFAALLLRHTSSLNSSRQSFATG